MRWSLLSPAVVVAEVAGAAAAAEVAGAAAAVFTCSSFQFVLYVVSKPTVVHGTAPT